MALNFNGTQEINVPNNITVNPKLLSVSFWLKYNVANFTLAGAISKRYYHDTLLRNLGYNALFAYGSTNNSLFDTYYIINLGATDLQVWHHYVVTYNGIIWSGYIDGGFLSAGNAGVTGNLGQADAGHLEIANQDPYTRRANGTFFDMRMYDRPLTVPEIVAIYNAAGSDSVTSGLVSRWRMDELASGNPAVAPNSIIDTSVNTNNGTPIGSPIYADNPFAPVSDGNKRLIDGFESPLLSGVMM